MKVTLDQCPDVDSILQSRVGNEAGLEASDVIGRQIPSVSLPPAFITVPQQETAARYTRYIRHIQYVHAHRQLDTKKQRPLYPMWRLSIEF